MSLVSVIVPIYNVEQFLPICLESILAQTMSEIEVILVDDGSTDDSCAICERYAQMDSRIKVIHKVNGGLASARQSGFDVATGDYIFCVDSDDCIHPSTIEKLYNEAQKTGADIVQCDLLVIDGDDDSYIHEVHHKGYYQLTPFNAYCVVEENDEKFGHNSRLATTVTWGKLIRTEKLKLVTPIKELRIHEDQSLISRLLSVINYIIFIESDFYYYRCRRGSIMKSVWKPEKLVILDIYKERLEIIGNLTNVSDDEREVLSKKVYRRYMISMIRNYIIVDKKRDLVKRNELKCQIHQRFLMEKRNKRGTNVSVSDKLMFLVFSISPYIGSNMYRIIKRKEKFT